MAEQTTFRTGINLAFDLPPQYREDPDLVELYDALILELRTEARGIPMNTIQTLLLERIAFYYVALKGAERSGTINPTQIKDMTKFWLDMTSEFNKQLAAGHEKLRESLLRSISDMVMEKLADIQDPEIKKTVILSLKEGFAEMGM